MAFAGWGWRRHPGGGHACEAVHGLRRLGMTPPSGRRDESNLGEGWLVPREPAYADKRSQDGEAPSASE